MARIRTIKPDFFRHHGLYVAEQETGLPLRVAFAGLWTACDREGRFRWKIEELKLDCLPFDSVDFSRVLDALTTRGFIAHYASGDHEFGAIPSWSKHQVINNRERASDIPPMPDIPPPVAPATRQARVIHASPTRHDPAQGEGKGREGEVEGKGNTTFALTSADAESTPEPPAYRLPLIPKDGHCDIMAEQVSKWRETYPGIDVDLEIRKTIAWTDANPAKRKTKAGAMRFMNAWLSKAQDMSGRNGAVSGRTGNVGTYGQPRDRGSAGLRPFEER